MAGFTSLSELTTKLALGHGKYVYGYTKTPVAAPVSARGFSFSTSSGLPGAITTPTVGLAGAVALDKTSPGAIYFQNAPAGEQTMIAKFDSQVSTSNIILNGGKLLVDRLAHANVSIVQATGSFSPVIDGTARLSDGEGAMIIAEVTTACSAASNVFTLTYTNESGVSHTTPQITTVASASAGTFPYANYFYIPLANGDRGVRTITGWNLVSGTATGNINIAIVKPIAWINTTIANDLAELDFAIMKQGLYPINDNSHLSMLSIGAYSSASFHSGTITFTQK